MEDEYRRVDGTRVPREQWYHTDKSLLPPPLTEEQKERLRERFNENKELLTETLKCLENGSLVLEYWVSPYRKRQCRADQLYDLRVMVSCSEAGQHKDPDVANYLVDNQSSQ
jgi:hypothetical protein